jgi:hypothetical protein
MCVALRVFPAGSAAAAGAPGKVKVQGNGNGNGKITSNSNSTTGSVQANCYLPPIKKLSNVIPA